MDWDKISEWEKKWWGTCQNTYGEEEKQLIYANRMGLRAFHNGKSPYNFDLQNKSVLDIGGGAASLLLKSVNTSYRVVVDPCDYPEWVASRYALAGIHYEKIKGEDIIASENLFDETWIYNVLQHTEDFRKVIENARQCSKIIRIFEWLNIKDDHGHPNELHKTDLDECLKGEGKTEWFDTGTMKGEAYYGIFKGAHYVEV